MEKIVIIILFVFCSFSNAIAQKFGYIDSEYIMGKMPEYSKAQQELNKSSEKWQKELETMRKQVDEFRKKFQAEEVLLTEEMKAERQDTLNSKEKGMRDFQKRIFGFEGMLFLKKQELIKPVQDKVFEAVEKWLNQNNCK